MTEHRHRRSRLAGTVLLGLQLALVLLTSVLVWGRRIEIPGCDLRCDFALLDATGLVYAVVASAILVLVGVLLFLSPARADRWWLPAGGIVLTLVAFSIANVVSDAALAPVPSAMAWLLVTGS